VKKAVKKAVTTHVKTKEVIVIDDDSGDGNDSEASIQRVEVITSSAASSKAQKKITSAKVRNVTSEQKEKMSDKRSKTTTTTTLLIDERSKSLTNAKQAPKANAKVKATDSQESPVVSRSDSRMRRSSSVVKSYAVDDVSEHEENSDDSSNDWG
jgi:hypothetical protein